MRYIKHSWDVMKPFLLHFSSLNNLSISLVNPWSRRGKTGIGNTRWAYRHYEREERTKFGSYNWSAAIFQSSCSLCAQQIFLFLLAFLFSVARKTQIIWDSGLVMWINKKAACSLPAFTFPKVFVRRQVKLPSKVSR